MCDVAMDRSSNSVMECLRGVHREGGGFEGSVERPVADQRLKVLSVDGDMLTRVDSVMEEIPTEYSERLSLRGAGEILGLYEAACPGLRVNCCLRLIIRRVPQTNRAMTTRMKTKATLAMETMTIVEDSLLRESLVVEGEVGDGNGDGVVPV